MIKLSDILAEVLTEKKLCPKGKAYYNRRIAAGEKPSAYLSGRAVKVCKGLMEENEEIIKCQNQDCGWEWKLEDGGKNPYVCHKCGYDNTDFYTSMLEHELNEAKQAGILYHYTQNWLLEKIIKSNTLQAPVSFTRSKDKKTVSWLGAECSLVIDGDKLSNNYKISPYRDSDGGENPFDEMEERVNKDITNLNKYLIKVILYEPDQKVENLLKEKNIPYGLNLNESLRDWFEKEDWVRIDTQGNITGPCGTMKKGKATTRCLPRAKANSLTKAERAATARKKVTGSKKGKQFVPNTKKAKVKLNK